ncbi:ribonuclease HI family protein [Candidatus Bipolaricaulota bacterium]|nr:ribonuclease HI family protein [Candidatus Bipolaricaulota bacterium]
MEKLFVYIDGAAKGNPGDAAIGIAITDPEGNVIEEISRLIGRATTEVAEYQALIEACKFTAVYKPQSVIFFTDNQKVANHINHVFESRAPHIRHLLEVAIGLLNQFPRWRVNYVDTHANFRAPRLVERAFHQNVKVQVARERLELTLRSRGAGLSDAALQRLIDYADRLQEEES